MVCMQVPVQDVDRAMDLAKEMRLRNVERNVHTYTALMNVCIKCGNCPLALDTYHHMRQDGTHPNVVTYNTLIECAACSFLQPCFAGHDASALS